MPDMPDMPDMQSALNEKRPERNVPRMKNAPQAEACGAFFMTGATSGGQWPTLIHRPHLPT